MQVSIKHTFTKAAGVARVNQALIEARPQLAEHVQDLTEHWEGDTLHFSLSLQGKKITGTLEVKDKEFDLNLTLPLLWRMFEGQIKKAIESQAQQALH